MKQERRRYHRTTVQLDITLAAAGGQWPAKTVTLSPYGAKVGWLPKMGTLLPGSSVQLRLPAMDQESPLSLRARVERTDSDGIALSFPALGDAQLQRLKALVDSLLLQEWRELATQLGTRPPVEGAEASDKKGAAMPRSITGTHPRQREEAVRDDGSERERLQALLQRLGLQNLQLPSDGPLARQWREFLKKHEVEE